MQEFHIATPDALESLCAILRGSPWLALDTEFMREKTYYPQFCLLQLCNGEIAATVDPLALADLSPLLDILCDDNIVKVFHAGRQDLELFHHAWKRLPAPLFDTQPAAELAGFGSQVGYANLVQQLTGHELEKGHTRTDWSARPLRPEQLRYALDDVIYLGQIYLQLRQRVPDAQHDPMFRKELDRLLDPDTYEPPAQNAWLRLKARKYLEGEQLAVLQTLAEWRETEARRADKPRGWILSNEALFELSRLMPRDPTQLKKIRGLAPRTVQRRGKHLLALIEKALESPETR